MTTKKYDPVPDLAALIDGVQGLASCPADVSRRRLLADLLTGPYARLRGGMLLDPETGVRFGVDEPGWDTASTTESLRETLRYLHLEQA